MIQSYFTLLLFVQIIHSIEEISTGFHKKWYLFKMPLPVFIVFEIIHSIFWISVGYFNEFPFRINLMIIFYILMFANGIQHIVWANIVKKYVPGLYTAPLFILIILIFLFNFYL